MKRTLLTLAVLLPFIFLSAQREYLPSPDDLEHFKSTRTYVVMNSSPLSEYNFEIKDAVEKLWTLTEYEFLEHKDFAEKSLDPNASFLYIAAVNFEKDKTGTRYTFLCLSLGGPDHTKLDELKDISNLPLSYHGVPEDQYVYKLGTLLRFMQNHVKMLMDDPAKVSQNVYQYYNKNMGSLKGKMLYLVEDEVDPRVASEAKLKEIYPYPFTFVDREDVKELMMKGDEKAVFLHKVGPEGKNQSARVYKALIGVSDAKFYYYNHHKANAKHPDAILMNDFKRISKAQTKE